MRLLRNRRTAPRTKTIRPAEPYLAAGASEARRLGHSFVGTEHVLLALVSRADAGATRVFEQLGIPVAAVEAALAPCLGGGTPTIDPDALATLGIDFDVVRARLEETFGPGALEQTCAACLAICPRLKLAFAYALDRAEGRPLAEEHILLGMLSVPESVAARILASLGVSLPDAEAVVSRRRA